MRKRIQKNDGVGRVLVGVGSSCGELTRFSDSTYQVHGEYDAIVLLQV
jgi:hypothetical protein